MIPACSSNFHNRQTFCTGHIRSETAHRTCSAGGWPTQGLVRPGSSVRHPSQEATAKRHRVHSLSVLISPRKCTSPFCFKYLFVCVFIHISIVLSTKDANNCSVLFLFCIRKSLKRIFPATSSSPLDMGQLDKS